MGRLDAANIDLKSFTDGFYRQICGARLDPVLDSIKVYKDLGIWTEITTLVIPSLNDSNEKLRKIAEFIRDLGDETPWHVSQFYPTYKLMDIAPTSLSALRRAVEIGKEVGLKYVYQGNVPGEGENTYCPKCGKLLIGRYGYYITENHIKGSVCPFCGTKIEGVWK